MTVTLYYFPLPGRAEAARLMLTIGKVDFIDKRISFDEWPNWKAKMPFGTMPVLEVDGKMIAQMAAIDRYCAAITGMLPADPLKLAEVEQVYFFLEDLYQPLGPVMQRKDATAEEKQKMYDYLLEPGSIFKQRLTMLNEMLANRDGKFLAGDQLTHADLAVFMSLSTFQSGWLSGLPRDILEGYPALKEFRNLIASLPDVAAFYAKEEDDVRKNGFRPEGEAPAGTA